METGSWNWCSEQQPYSSQPDGPARGPADLVQHGLKTAQEGFKTAKMASQGLPQDTVSCF
eukprot:4719871-Pyramimonas_sp.AAC.1